MVFFTCNNCGESIRKSAVEKHYSFKCRDAPKNVSCMDCMKDFRGEEYVAHIKCITEAEKYSGKGFVPKEPKNSGQKKQESWMDIIRSILASKEYNLSPAARSAFQKLQNQDNVPRKKAKFLNFAANCIKMSKYQVEEIWNVLEKELGKMKASKEEAAPRKEEEPAQPVVSQAAEETVAEPNEAKEIFNGDVTETTRVKKSKSKKRKGDKEIQNAVEMDEEAGTQAEATVEPSKKKKKKSSVAVDSVGKQEEVNDEQEPTISTTTPDEFKWSSVIDSIVHKHEKGMKVEKLKKKVLKQYLSRQESTEFTEKQQAKFDKKFAKYLKKSNLKIEDNVVRVE